METFQIDTLPITQKCECNNNCTRGRGGGAEERQGRGIGEEGERQVLVKSLDMLPMYFTLSTSRSVINHKAER